MSTSLYIGQCIAVFGTASLQRYIFQSNRLKENIGASYLVKYWLDKGLVAAMQQTGCIVDRTAWDSYQKDPCTSVLRGSEEDADIEVIYVGGGNAALLCKTQEIAKDAVKSWSRKLLKKAPGLRVAVGYADVENSLAVAYRDALDDLASCEEALPFGATLYGLPVVRTCTTTGLPASVPSEENNKEWISQSAMSKRNQVGSEREPGVAQKDIRREFKSVLKEDQHFAIELNKLGGRKGESHIAVVHADSNGMGKHLIDVVNSAGDDVDFLHHIRAFSASVSCLSRIALKETLQYLREALPGLKDDLSLEDEKIFPLRPIVYGGDDLTFVCDGRLGLDLAAFYLKEFSKGTIKVCGEDKPIDACAGVAIVPTKFPFARAYHFAEELCGLTKSYLRQENLTGSWLDFQIIQEGVTRSISALRAAQYLSLKDQTLHQRPYKVPEQWDVFVSISKEFQPQKWPRSRAKGLLQALTQGPVATQRFIEGAKWRGLKPPSVKGIDGSVKETGWTGGDPPDRTTPYFDPLEALDFYLEAKPATDSEDAGEGEKE